MQFVNHSPFVSFQYESIDKQLNLFGTTALRGTFDIEHQKRLNISEEQESLILTDEYFGNSNTSSLRHQTSLVPYKPRTDLLIEATAYAPGGKPCETWTVGVNAGPIKKQFTVTGRRSWIRKLGINRLSDIEPTKTVDIRYENAYGGNASSVRCDDNPVGIGFHAGNYTNECQCPQLLASDVQSPAFGKPLAVQGLGPLAPSWAPRLNYVGTVDEKWRATRFPYLPLDFDFFYYNAAPPDQIFPGFAKGDEAIHLYNLSPHHELSFGLPDIQMIHLIQFEDGRLAPAPIKLDTIHVDVNRMKVFLEWRGIYPLHIPIKFMEVRLSAPDYLKAA
jgi:hypothetical protein